MFKIEKVTITNERDQDGRWQMSTTGILLDKTFHSWDNACQYVRGCAEADAAKCGAATAMHTPDEWRSAIVQDGHVVLMYIYKIV